MSSQFGQRLGLVFFLFSGRKEFDAFSSLNVQQVGKLPHPARWGIVLTSRAVRPVGERAGDVTLGRVKMLSQVGNSAFTEREAVRAPL
jgi:hypothetical protein